MKHVLLLLVVAAACASYPGTEDLDDLMKDLPRIPQDEARHRRVRSFLDSIRNPSDGAEDRLAESALRKLADYHAVTGDEAVLSAADETEIDGGFANMMCVFYEEVLRSERARSRYRANCHAIERCEGISFSRKDLEQICKAS